MTLQELLKEGEKEFDAKWYVPGGSDTNRDGDYWYYQAINQDDPSSAIQSLIASRTTLAYQAGLDRAIEEAEQRGADSVLNAPIDDSYEGKFWSRAVQIAMDAPFPEVAMQHLMMRAYYNSRVEALENVLNKKREAVVEREAISPMGIVSIAQGDEMRPAMDSTVRQLQYVKVFDVEKLLEEARSITTKV